jgi:NTE family protein
MTTGFVLSGGASLGAVQVGMLRALAEHDVRPDLVIGTSAGAINAAWIAGHPDLGGLDELAAIWAALRTRDVFPLRPGQGMRALLMGQSSALISSDPLRRLIARHLTFERIEDAPVPLRVVATDVLSGEEVLLDRGDALSAIAASAALPGIFPPVELDGRVLIDGGIANNTPISHAVELGADTVYVLPTGHGCALDAAPHHPLSMVLHAFTLLVQQRLAQDVDRYRGSIDLRVAPALCPQRVSPADFSHAPELINRAYLSTRRWLDEPAPTDDHAPRRRHARRPRARAKVAAITRTGIAASRNPGLRHSESG